MAAGARKNGAFSAFCRLRAQKARPAPCPEIRDAAPVVKNAAQKNAFLQRGVFLPPAWDSSPERRSGRPPCSMQGRAAPCGADARGKHFFLHTGRSARLWEKRAFPLRAALLRHIAARRMRHEGCLSWGRTLPRSLGTAGLMRSFPGIIPDNRSRAQRSGSALCRVHRQGGPGRAAHPSFLVK